MIPYTGKDTCGREPHQRLSAQQKITPAIMKRAREIQSAHPDWSARMIANEVSREIKRWPPFTAETMSKHLRRGRGENAR